MDARTPKTLYDKIWDSHLVHEAPGEASVLYIDRHLVHEVTSAQAFEGLRETGRKARGRSQLDRSEYACPLPAVSTIASMTSST